MVGAPGAGKSMLAQRLPGLLPPRSEAEALASAALAGLGGAFDAAHWKVRPFRSPHHSASAPALVGGGSPPRPGEISLAYGGVLFLDEMAEMPRAALEALREPLETGRITISRAARQASFPARFFGARRGDEPLSLRLARRHGRRATAVPLHARPDRALPGPAVGASARPHRPESRGARRGGQGTDGPPRRRGEQRRRGARALGAAAIDIHCALYASARALLQRAAERLG
jgi:magnesium chelatase family protein